MEKDKAVDKCVEGNVTAFSKDQILCFCLANAAYKICHVIVSDRRVHGWYDYVPLYVSSRGVMGSFVGFVFAHGALMVVMI